MGSESSYYLYTIYRLHGEPFFIDSELISLISYDQHNGCMILRLSDGCCFEHPLHYGRLKLVGPSHQPDQIQYSTSTRR